MSEPPKDKDMGTNGEFGEPDDIPAMDRALLLALSGVPRDSAPLTIYEEELLDDWVAGRLSPADAGRAERLASRNSLAAEFVLERRLVAAANSGGPVPANVTTQILEAVSEGIWKPERSAAAATARSAEPRSAISRLPASPTGSQRPQPGKSSWSGWSIFGWSAAGLAFAATVTIAVLGVQNWWEEAPSRQRIQVAMVSLDDRKPGGSQVRSIRSNTPAPSVSAAAGSRDVNIPTELLRRAISSAETGTGGAIATELLPYLPPGAEKAGPTRVAIDSDLADALSHEWSSRAIVPVRVYDLSDPQTKAIRDRLAAKTSTPPQLFLTLTR